jgi:hypothetical protein
MLAARVEPKNAPQESEKSDNFKPLVFREFRAGVDTCIHLLAVGARGTLLLPPCRSKNLQPAFSDLTPCSLFVLVINLRGMETFMRRVEIVEDPRSQRCWVAVDVKSGEPVMRLHDRGLLERLCESLEWKLVLFDKQRSRRVVRG